MAVGLLGHGCAIGVDAQHAVEIGVLGQVLQVLVQRECHGR